MAEQLGAQTVNPMVVDSGQEGDRKNDSVNAYSGTLASSCFS